MAKDIFEKYDTDHNGTLDREETKCFFLDQLRQLGMKENEVTDEQFEDGYNKADTNKDGVVSFDEVV